MSELNKVRRIYVQKKESFDVEAKSLMADLVENLGISSITDLKILVRYDVEGISKEEYEKAKLTIFAEAPVDLTYDEDYPFDEKDRVIAIEFLPGQFDQRADSAAQCIQMLTEGEKPLVRVAKIIILSGNITDEQYETVKLYCINPVEAQSASLDKVESLEMKVEIPTAVEIIDNFINMSDAEIEKMVSDLGLAMSKEDLLFTQDYFANKEKRNPTITEIRMLDTYWSDHCRHTTFATKIDNVEFEKKPQNEVIEQAYENYISIRKEVLGDKIDKKPMCLMDMATIAAKYLKKQGKLDNLDESEEINACSIVVKADIDGKEEDWLVMFKNETHNHPTEIEPFGGAATCLGGAIRDPLSGRSYVYQAMRITGSGDPNKKIEDTLPGKLPQRKISKTAAHGYSSYGNQIGLATGKVVEIYHEGYVAKRMEIGAVVGAAPKKNVRREVPAPGDSIVLLGGRTGRDGCGGATGSSKEHDEKSLESCGAEVQKGNAPTERKLQRLFRDGNVTRMIKRCNDFGAGGVSVAIGELADGLDINLDLVPKKYDGLDGTEIAISESQERMACVIEPENVEAFIAAANKENLEAVVVAVVTDKNRLTMKWKDQIICDIDREFINTNGVSQHTDIFVKAPDFDNSPLKSLKNQDKTFKTWTEHVAKLNNASNKGLAEMFDSTIGAGTVLMPFGGTNQLSPTEGMVAKLPVEHGDTTTVTMMAHGFDADISSWSPFHGAVYAVTESIARLVAMGCDYRTIRLTFQEYFEKLGTDKERWGKPFAALLGAICAQQQFGVAAIGGKDSMSGTFKDLDVPPTLVSFALGIGNSGTVISNDLKGGQTKLVLLRSKTYVDGLPNVEYLLKMYDKVHKLIKQGVIKSANSIKKGGIAQCLTDMAVGNMVGMSLDPTLVSELYDLMYGSLIVEIDAKQCPCDDVELCWDANESMCLDDLFGDVEYRVIGITLDNPYIVMGNEQISLYDVTKSWRSTFEKVYPTKAKKPDAVRAVSYTDRSNLKPKQPIAKPRVFIPVFPGTNCEYDTAKRFEIAGAIPDIMVIKNTTGSDVEESIREMEKRINQSQMIMIPGGFSAGDEPDGSGKFIATAFKNPIVSEAVMNLLNNRDGLVLGICNGFQALIKLGLLPYGEIRQIDDNSPTLTYNNIGRHVSCYVNTRVASVKSPWLSKCNVGDIHSIPVSHGEGRFVANDAFLKQLEENGQIAFQYTDAEGNPSDKTEFNPNGSVMAIEGICSPDGRVLGKMGHSERIGRDIAKNIYGNKNQMLFESGVEYFTK